jgi:hypothetical protein
MAYQPSARIAQCVQESPLRVGRWHRPAFRKLVGLTSVESGSLVILSIVYFIRIPAQQIMGSNIPHLTHSQHSRVK